MAKRTGPTTRLARRFETDTTRNPLGLTCRQFYYRYGPPAGQSLKELERITDVDTSTWHAWSLQFEWKRGKPLGKVDA